MKKKLSLWQLGLASAIISAIGGLSSRKSRSQAREVYTAELKQAPWAPPPWLFGPAWTVNNFFLLKGMHNLIHSSNPDKKTLLNLQIPIWTIFFTFGIVYFRKKSPLLAAGWTVADAVLAATSYHVARKSDKQLSYHFLPLLSWTTFASTLAIYQALKNDDPVLETPALA